VYARPAAGDNEAMTSRPNWIARCAAVACIFLPALVVAAQDKPVAPLPLRVLSYNIHHAEGVDKKLDLRRIADVIKSTNPDLVAVQEVDVNTKRANNVDQAAELAKLTGLHVYFAKAMPYQGGSYGQAILSRHPMTETATHPLPGEPNVEPRTVARATVKVANQTITFFATHLDHKDEPARVKQAEEINALAGTVPADHTLLLAGDLNSRPGSAPMRRLFAHWKNATEGDSLWTIPVDKPKSQIDYVLHRTADNVKVIEKQVLDQPTASDHRPILAILEIGGK
jgi:endonuclease/exonuclease/phosphatase family metal-dependent hydrolase